MVGYAPVWKVVVVAFAAKSVQGNKRKWSMTW